MQDEMFDVHLDRWQFNNLVGVVRLKRHEFTMATSTGGRLNEVDLGGAEQRGALAAMSLLPASLAGRQRPVALGRVEGGI